MKRGMGGGALRGPLGLRRQRRTIRFVQLLLVALGVALVVVAIGTASGTTSRPDPRTFARAGSLAQPIVLGLLALAAWGAAWLLTDGRGVRIPTPARLDELAGRAEQVAIEKAEAVATEES